MYARALIWWTILRICVEERLVYRGDFALGTLMRFLPFITQIFLWRAVFASRAEPTIGGYTYNEMIAYLLLTNISRAFSSMPGLSTALAALIRTGEIKKYLAQPIDLIGFYLLSRVAHKLVYYLVAAAPFALVFYLCRGFFAGWPDAVTMTAFMASLVLAFLLGYFLEATIGMVGFWFLEVSSLLFVYQLFSFFISGQMFPIDILPQGVQGFVDLLPVPYLAYFPVAVFLGKVQGADLVRGLAIEVGWVVFFMLASRFALHRGLKRYSAFGG